MININSQYYTVLCDRILENRPLIFCHIYNIISVYLIKTLQMVAILYTGLISG